MAESVLIVGAGPVGLTVANLLTAQGIGVRIVTAETERRPVEYSRAEGNHARTLAVYERLGVLDEVQSRGRRVYGAAFHDGDRRLGAVDMDDPTSYYRTVILGQSRIERILEIRLADAGVDVQRGWTLTGLDQSDQHASATLTGPDAETITVDAAYIVACDGGRSTARKLLGAAFDGDTSDIQYALADVQITTRHRPYDDDMHVWFNPMMMLARLDGDYWRAVAPTDASQPLPDSPESVLRTIQDRFDRNGVAVTIHAPRWTSMFRVNTRGINHMRWGRIFFAGDSAHVHSPMGGQGMNEGIQDALNLAWKLTAVLNHGAPDGLLDTYDAERQPFIADLLKDTQGMTRFMEGSSAPFALLRNTVIAAITRLAPLQPAVRRRFTGANRSIDHSSIVADPHARRFPRRAPRPGQRAPDARGISSADRTHPSRLFTHWQDAHHHELLIFAGRHEIASRREELSAIADDIERRCAPTAPLRARVVTRSGTATLNFYLDGESDLLRRYAITTECIYLIRPDGFIAYRSPTADPEPVIGFLRDAYRP